MRVDSRFPHRHSYDTTFTGIQTFVKFSSVVVCLRISRHPPLSAEVYTCVVFPGIIYAHVHALHRLPLVGWHFWFFQKRNFCCKFPGNELIVRFIASGRRATEQFGSLWPPGNGKTEIFVKMTPKKLTAVSKRVLPMFDVFCELLWRSLVSIVVKAMSATAVVQNSHEVSHVGCSRSEVGFLRCLTHWPLPRPFVCGQGPSQDGSLRIVYARLAFLHVYLRCLMCGSGGSKVWPLTFAQKGPAAMAL